MEAEAAFVGPNRAVELDPVSPVSAHITFVVCPGDAEVYNALRLSHPLQNLVLVVMWLIRNVRKYR